MPDKSHRSDIAAKRKFLKKSEQENEWKFSSVAFPGDIFCQLTNKGEDF
jgi:hypothetical protein